MNELNKILAGLANRTSEGRLKWTTTVRDDRFTTSIDAISIVIGLHSRGYELEIFDEAGRTVESLNYSSSTGEQYEQLERLYVLARRSALDIQSTLDKLAKALDL